MILTAHQPAYLPWLGLFHKIYLADAFTFYDNVQFEKDSFINRNKIKTQTGNFIWLTVPVETKDHFEKKISEIKIAGHSWQKKHWHSLCQYYSKAPYFKRYADFFDDLYNKKEWHYVSELNEYILRWFLNILDIKIKFYRGSELELMGKKSDKILDMCQKLKADLFIFGTLGRDYAKKEDFTRAGVKIYFQEYNHPKYSQLGKGFQPHMSIVDLLFNEGPKSLDIIMQNNITKQDLLSNQKLYE